MRRGRGFIRRQVSSSRFIAKAMTERTNAGGRWAARPSLKSLPDSFSPWPVAICKVQRRISQGSSYRVTVRAARRYDSSMFSTTIPSALMIRLNDDFLLIFSPLENEMPRFSIFSLTHLRIELSSRCLLESVLVGQRYDTRRGVVAKCLRIRHSRHLRALVYRNFFARATSVANVCGSFAPHDFVSCMYIYIYI